MDLENFDVIEAFKQRFGAYKKIMDEKGEQAAWDTLFQGYPERQKELMGRFIDNCSLAEGFTNAIPVYKQMGMEMEVVDISNKGKDAVIEVQKTCPALTLCKEYGFEKPCRIVCEMDVEATKIAFADDNIQGGILSRQADGNCVCIFMYERTPK
jgi:hypothetical protein